MQKIQQLRAVEIQHAEKPAEVRSRLLTELNAEIAPAQPFQELAARAAPAPTELTPEIKAARAHFTAVKAELGIA